MNSNINNEFTELFAKAAKLENREPLLTREEISRLLTNEGAPGTGILSKLFNSKKGITMLISAAAIFTTALIWFAGWQDTEPPGANPPPESNRTQASAVPVPSDSGQVQKETGSEYHKIEKDSVSSSEEESEEYDEVFRVFKVKEASGYVKKSVADAGDESIPGIIVLELETEELARLGIELTEQKCSFHVEQILRIHPIRYRKQPKYRKYHEVRPYAEAGYDTTGKLFLAKEKWTINLAGEDVLRKIDSLEDLVDQAREPEGFFDLESRWDMVPGFHDPAREAMEKEIIEYEGWPIEDYSQTAPVVITFDFLDRDKTAFKNIYKSPITYKDFSEKPDYQANYKFTEMIPVTVRLAPEDTNPDETDYIIEKITFWFVPTDDFLQALPDRYKLPLMKELKIYTDFLSGEKSVEEACKGLEGSESFFDLCRINSGAIRKLKLSPNPSQGYLNCEFLLIENRYIKITLYDLNGKALDNLFDDDDMEAGMHSEGLDLSGLENGVYLIAVITDKGEQAVSRLIIQK